MKNFHPKTINLILVLSMIALTLIYYDNSRIEENQKKPMAQAFNKTIEDMYNNKYIREFIEAE
jgi:hypothetical protein